MSQKHHKNVCGVLNYIKCLLIFVFAVTGCASISAFASLVAILVAITGSAVGSKICVLTAGIKKCKSIIKKKKEIHDQIILVVKAKLNSIEVLISKTLIKSNISHDEFVSINNVLRI